MDSIRNIHFVGIGGIGMCGIAEVLFNQGYHITGSDIQSSPVIERLQHLGMQIFIGHDAKQVQHADVVVVSTVIHTQNPEITQAHALHIPVIHRAQMLGELMRFRYGIAVSGTHGKTTTTSIISTILAKAKLDPTYVIGGRINNGSTAKLGQGDYMVVEADESDKSFMHLKPIIAVVTNVDNDHMETYDFKEEKLLAGFTNFLQLLPFYGLAVMNIDDERVRRLLDNLPCRALTYGFSKDADLCIQDWYTDGYASHFNLVRKNKEPVEITIQLPGKHNVLNTVAAIGAVEHCQVNQADILTAVNNFSGVSRRFDVKGEFSHAAGALILLDDYGHHPAEILANLQAVKQVWPNRRIVMLLQPHRYSRIRAMLLEFVAALQLVDVLLLLPVYAAGEQYDQGSTSATLMEHLPQAHLIDNMPSLSQIQHHLQDQDILITQGAGSVNQLCQRLIQELAN